MPIYRGYLLEFKRIFFLDFSRVSNFQICLRADHKTYMKNSKKFKNRNLNRYVNQIVRWVDYSGYVFKSTLQTAEYSVSTTHLLKVLSLTHSKRVFRDIFTTPVRIEILENSTRENISIFSLNIFCMFEAKLVLCMPAAPAPDKADQPPADRLLYRAPDLRDESEDRVLRAPSS